MSESLKILLIEDEPQMRRFLRASLVATPHCLIEAPTAAAGLACASEHRPDIILLDLGLPDMDGLEVTKRLRTRTQTPIIVLSARLREQDKVATLDAGADDYLTKPFGLPELLARIRVARRHAGGAATLDAGIISAGDVKVDLGKRIVTRAGEEARLTPVEYKLLVALARSGGRIMTYEQLLKEVWGARYTGKREYLHVYIGHLRSKLEHDPARPRVLLTESGVGYRLKVDA